MKGSFDARILNPAVPEDTTKMERCFLETKSNVTHPEHQFHIFYDRGWDIFDKLLANW